MFWEMLRIVAMLKLGERLRIQHHDPVDCGPAIRELARRNAKPMKAALGFQEQAHAADEYRTFASELEVCCAVLRAGQLLPSGLQPPNLIRRPRGESEFVPPPPKPVPEFRPDSFSERQQA